MLNLILKALKDAKILLYAIKENDYKTVELFYTKKDLSMKRQTDIVDYTVNVYMEFEHEGIKMLGNSVVFLSDNMTYDEILEKISNAKYSALKVYNKFYTLPSDLTGHEVVNYLNISLDEAANIMANALYEADNHESAFVNSSEIFIQQNNVRIITSQNVDVKYSKFRVFGEYVCQQKEPEDVELYETFGFDGLNTNTLTNQVKTTLEQVALRSKATKIEAGTYDILLTGSCVRDFINFYTDRSCVNMLYPKYSDYKIGNFVQGSSVKGDKLNIMLKADVPYTMEGIHKVDRQLIVNGRLNCYFGDCRFSHYLDVEATGMYNDIIVDAGSISYSDLKDGKLELLSFSNFQVDAMSGYFGGEVRLGILHKDGQDIPVTNFSISGNVLQAQENLVLSKEMQTVENYDGPLCIAIENIKVSG